MNSTNILSEVKKKNKSPVDYEYISNDPGENADNFDPKWALLRNIKTDEERYRVLRKTWGSTEIPDPRINLTCRQRNQTNLGTKEDSSGASKSSETNPVQEKPSTDRCRRKMLVSRRRSRSCTRPYEQLISNLQKDYQIEFYQMMHKHRAELQEMLLSQMGDAVRQLGNFYKNPYYYKTPEYEKRFKQNLQLHQELQVNHLLTSQYRERQRLIGAKNENLEAYKRYMEEVKAFFTFYQKINDDEVTLQMTDEQYEHTVETEKMYSLYHTFYR